MVHPRGLLAGVLVFFIAAMAVPAQAQLPSQFLDIEVTATLDSIERDGLLGTFTVAVTNPTQSPFPAAVTLNVTDAPAGWTATLAETDFELVGGESKDVALVLEAADDAETTDIEVTVTAVARYASPVPGVPSSPPATGSVDIQYGFERDFIAGIEHELGMPIWVPLLVVFVLLAAVILLVLRRGAPLSLDAEDAALQVPAGSTAVLPVRVHNPSGRAASANLSVSGVPDGWDVELEHAEVILPPRQSAVVQVRAHVPADARGGVREMAVLAGRQSGVEDARAALAVEVRAPTPSKAAAARPAGPAADPKAPTATKRRRQPAAKKPAKAPAKPKATLNATAPAAATFSDYAGQSRPVEEIEGIGPVYGERLRQGGIHSTARLSYESAEQVAKVSQVPVKTAEQWQSMIQLMKIKGVGPQYAEALTRAGVKDIASLRRRKPEKVAAQVTEYLESLEVSVVGNKVSAKRVESWQAAAKQMRKGKQPVPEQ